ncbi:class I SAM-dependent methyltransferase [Neorhodopirellula lusitana]|uniref:class I SAM-dependent methyltransferase n=1 Tax=Neorhodopirellula lusitana TaxID=445327 RepID=UPI0038502B29
MLQRIELPGRLNDRPVPDSLRGMIHDLHQRIETFQDRWDVPQVEQFVAADYELVYQTLDWIRESQLLIGNRFVEWGCGFATVTVIADMLGFDAIGIESEATLIEQGRKTISDWWQPLRQTATDTGTDSASGGNPSGTPTSQSPVGQSAPPELFRGNFLPSGADDLADDPTLPSLGHDVPPAYRSIGLDLDDFAVVYSYPWPGEDEFHESVFAEHAAPGAILVQFAGPNDTRAWRRLANDSNRANSAY